MIAVSESSRLPSAFNCTERLNDLRRVIGLSAQSHNGESHSYGTRGDERSDGVMWEVGSAPCLASYTCPDTFAV